MQNNKILKTFQKDANIVQFKIEHTNLYNTIAAIIRFFLKGGQKLEKCIPLVLSALIVTNSSHFKKNKPFRSDILSKPAYIQMIDASNGIHEENILAIRHDNIVEYSTGWLKNNNEQYERVVTTYKINSKINSTKLEEIFSMTEDELFDLLKIVDVNVITKDYLTTEDKVYNEDVITVIQYAKSNDKKVLRQETDSECYLNMSTYVAFVLLYASWLKKIKKALIKSEVGDKLEECLSRFEYVNEHDLDELKKILEIKKQNVAILKEDVKDDKGFSRVRKR